MEKTCSYFKNAWLEKRGLINKESVFSCLLAGILIAIPLKYAFSSLATILLITVAFSSFFKIKFSFNTHLFLPVIFYLIMLTSLMWTSDTELTSGGLQKELAFLFVPLPFLFIPDIKKINRHLVFRLFSLSMVFYALFYFVKAALRYRTTGDISVFFYHELVTQDLSAIYVSVFASFAIFYFVAKKNKNYFEKAALFILIALVFLLSSKSIITIDFILIVCYYSFFSDIPKSVKGTTVIAVFSFLFFSLVYVKEVRERFLLEYETAFVDNTVNNKIGNDNAKVFNVSLKQAWHNDKFQPNHFFPGTALRIFQIRAFKEMLDGNSILLTGFGLQASQNKIREKVAEHNLNLGYGDFNFHNQYVQTFAEIGIFGFFVLITMLYSNLKNAWKNEDFLHIAFAVTMIVLFLTESFFCRQRGVLFFITLYCVFNSTLKPTEEKYNL
ncbi:MULTISPECIES: O-antigen ligase family protein [Flavobacterium]|uniref:O-antigen ligase family protein n=1 Tax=Flavobacterium TaxID=237 RepID=UPI001FCC9CAD|nr:MULTISPECIES: O-antigen ligase family protein [Flavobacterium]UOK43169.1 O-antigen ligase family protein [Flavobacterium enshiense]